MDKLAHTSHNTLASNIAKIADLFPNTVTETLSADGTGELAINFDLLRQELTGNLLEGGGERYQLDWPGKRASILAANSPTLNTLRPQREESVNFDTTENLFIEGDNLEVLKLLQESYLGKIKMIYIDPPYNTGKDFVYNDNFAESVNDYLKRTGEIDEDGTRMVTNHKTNGRYHSDWLSMMYPRLKLARNLLTDDGVIFISIDDNEQANLKKICDEIFGDENFVKNVIWLKGNSQSDAKNIQNNHEHILVYARNIEILKMFKVDNKRKEVFKDGNKFYYEGSEIVTGGAGGTLNMRPNLGYTIYFNPKNKSFIAVDDYDREKAKTFNNEDEVYADREDLFAEGYTVKIRAPKKGTKLGRWSWGINKFNTEKKNLLIKEKKTGRYSVKKKIFVSSENIKQENGKYFIEFENESNFKSVLDSRYVIEDTAAAAGTKEVGDLFNEKIFDNPKSINLYTEYMRPLLNDNDVILDFFAGSATTAHAVLQFNAEDGKDCKFIMVQLPEILDIAKSSSVQAIKNAIDMGYKTIPEISRERIRRAGAKIQEEFADELEERDTPLDTGFRALKLDSPNMANVEFSPQDTSQFALDELVDNVKADRTAEDLLFQTLLALGKTLNLEINAETIGGKKVFNVANGEIIACFDTEINDDTIREIAKQQPAHAVFRDASFQTDADRTNTEQIFKELSSATRVQVI